MSIVLPPVSTISIVKEELHPQPTPFCDKNFKWLRVSVESIGRICLAIFYGVISKATWLFSATTSHTYATYAKCQELLAVRHFYSYFSYGEKVVDFSFNSSIKVKTDTVDNIPEIDKLKTLYGEERVEEWSKLFPAILDQLSRLAPVKDGCCFGVSCHFISSYLQQMKTTDSPEDAIKAIAPQYSSGAPENAQLGQIFYKAASNLRNTKAQKYINSLKSQVEKVEIDLKKSLDEINNQSTDSLILVEEAMQRMRDKAEECNNKFKETYLRFQDETEENCETPTLKGFKLNCTERIEFENFESDQELALQNSIKQAPNGAFLLGLRNEEVGHAIALIKTSNSKYYIFDPNLATLKYSNEEFFLALSALIKDSYTVKSLTLRKCALI